MPRLGMRQIRVAWLCALALLAGCAGYADTTKAARDTYYAGDLPGAEALFTELLQGAGRAKDEPLLLMERGIVRLARGEYSQAAQDLQRADSVLEVMDFTDDPGQIGKYLFSEDSGLYRGPPHEKILLPALISIAYGAMGELGRARTAANAAYSQVVRFDAERPDADFPSPLAFLLLGVACELQDDPQRAYEAYYRAYQEGGVRCLAPVLSRLLATNAKRFGGHWQRQLKRLSGLRRAPRPLPADHGELMVFVLNGRAPVRAESQVGMSPQQHNYFFSQAMANLNRDKPEVDPREAQPLFSKQQLLPMAVLQERFSAYDSAQLQVESGPNAPLERVLSVGEQVRRWFELNRDAQVTAALTRFAVKIAARVGTYLATKNETNNAAMAFLMSWIVGETLDAVDTPDTRCWALLPETVLFTRVPVRAGAVSLRIDLRGPGGSTTVTRQTTVRAGKPSFVLAVVPN